METDISIIKKLSKEREDENWKFRAFLKCFDGKKTDSISHKLFKQFSEAIDCTACGNCCRVVQPILLKKDIDNLAKHLKITPKQFKKSFVVKDEDGDEVFYKLPCPFLRENKCRYYGSRPSDCVSYPHLDEKHFASRLIGVIYNCSICPIVFNVYEAMKSELNNEFIQFQEEFD